MQTRSVVRIESDRVTLAKKSTFRFLDVMSFCRLMISWVTGFEYSHTNEMTEIKASSKWSYIVESSFNCLPKTQPAECVWVAIEMAVSEPPLSMPVWCICSRQDPLSEPAWRGLVSASDGERDCRSRAL